MSKILFNTKNNQVKKIHIIIFIFISIIFSRLIMYIVYIYFALKNNKSSDFNSFIMLGLNHQNLNRIDSDWYNSILEDGYGISTYAKIRNNGMQNWAFFPLMPILIKLFHFIIPINYYLLGTIINTFILGFTSYFAFKYIMMTRNNYKSGIFVILLLIFGPFSWYCSSLLSESLFMFLLVLSLYFMKQKKYIYMGITGAFLSATRNLGIFFTVVVLLHSIFEYIKSKKINYNLKNYFIYLYNNPKLIISVLMIPIGFFSFCTYLHFKVGDGFAFMHVQWGWRQIEHQSIFIVLKQNFITNKVSFFSAILGILISIWLIINKKCEEAVIPLITILIGINYTLASQQRYLFASTTLAFGLSDLISIKENNNTKYIRICSLTILVLLNFFLLNAWYSYEWNLA